MSQSSRASMGGEAVAASKFILVGKAIARGNAHGYAVLVVELVLTAKTEHGSLLQV